MVRAVAHVDESGEYPDGWHVLLSYEGQPGTQLMEITDDHDEAAAAARHYNDFHGYSHQDVQVVIASTLTATR